MTFPNEKQVGLFSYLMRTTRLHEDLNLSLVELENFARNIGIDTYQDLIDAIKRYDKTWDKNEKQYIVGQINHLLK